MAFWLLRWWAWPLSSPNKVWRENNSQNSQNFQTLSSPSGSGGGRLRASRAATVPTVQYTFTSQHFLSREIVSIRMKTYSGCPRGIKEVRTSGAFGPQPHNYRASQDSPKLSRVISCPLNLKTRFTCHVPRWLEEEVIDGDSVTAPRFISNEKETNFKQNTFKHYTFFWSSRTHCSC